MEQNIALQDKTNELIDKYVNTDFPTVYAETRKYVTSQFRTKFQIKTGISNATMYNYFRGNTEPIKIVRDYYLKMIANEIINADVDV